MKIPYFMTNPEWYKEIPLETNDRGYILTDKAPQSAIDSYNEFYNNIEIDNGELFVINK